MRMVLAIDVDDDPAILAEKAVAQSFQHVDERAVDMPARQVRRRAHCAPAKPERPPAPPDGGFPIALRSKVKAILCPC